VLLGGSAVMDAWGWGDSRIRTTVFMALVLGVFLLVLANRDQQRSLLASLRPPNRWLARMLLAVVMMLVLALGLPWLRQVMGFSVPPAAALGVAALMLAASAAWMEVLRLAAAAVQGLSRQER
jgi:Ca2+-transporting ATPase